MFSFLIRAIQSESIKNRHTKTIWLLIILASCLPLLIAALQIFGIENLGGNIDSAPENYSEVVHKIASVFSMFIFPMAIILISAQSASVEHKNNTWQLVETQPLPKWSIYLAKFLTMIKTLIIFIVLFYAISYVILYVLYIIYEKGNPSYYFSIDLWELFLRMLNMLLSSMAYSALFFSLHMNIKRTNLISTIGVVSIIGYMIALGFQYQFPRWFPLLQMGTAAGEVSEVGEWITYFSRISIILGVFILSLGYAFYSYKTHRAYFFKSTKGLITTFITLVLGVTAVYFAQLPRIQQSYGHSVIAGHLDSDIKISEIYLKETTNHTTVATIPVDDQGNFHINLDSIHIPKQHYMFFGGESNILFQNESNDEKFTTFITNGDSIHVELSLKNNFTSAKITGDRRAEAASKFVTNPNALLHLKILDNYKKTENLTVNHLLENLQSFFEKDIDMIDNHVTIDGYQLAADFKTFRANLIKVFYLQKWEELLATHYPESQNQTFDFIENIKKSINADDPDFWKVDEFLKYQMTQKLGQKELKDIDILTSLDKLPSEQIKNQAAGYALKNIMNNTSVDDTTALRYYDEYIGLIKEPAIKNALELTRQSRIVKLNK